MLTIKLAIRNLFRNTRRTILTVLLIGFSLTALIFTDGLVKGMLSLMIENVTESLFGEARIHHPNFLENLDVDYYIDEVDKIESELAKDPAIAHFSSRVISSEIGRAHGRTLQQN